MASQNPETDIAEQVNVTRQKVIVAKAFFLTCFGASHDHTGTDHAVKRFLADVGAVDLKTSQASGQSEWVPSLGQIAEAISWQVAAHEALWELVHANELIAGSAGQWEPSVEYETPHYKGGWRPPGFAMAVLQSVHRPPSTRYRKGETLADADLYLQQLAISDLTGSVEDALRETVACFRHELFTAAVVMLGKASEEAWIETGTALYNAVLGAHASSKVQELTGSRLSIAAKVDGIRKVYEGSSQAVWRPSGVDVQEFRHAVLWSETVRNSRNVVHAGVSPYTPNTYEKVAVLLLGVPRVFRALFAVRRASSDLASQPNP